MKFEEALQLLKAGKKVREMHWKAGQYIYLEKGALIDNEDKLYGVVNIGTNSWEEYKEPTKLSNEEKELLRNLFECVENFPSVEYAYRVDKREDFTHEYEYLRIWYKIKGGDTDHYICSPQFDKGTMFKEFDPVDYYKIEELGLYEETSD